MKRIVEFSSAIALGCAAMIPTASATIVLASGSYAADDPYFHLGVSPHIIPGLTAPGTYLFTFTVSSPFADLFDSSIIKYPTYNFYCDFGDGQGAVYCGGDETPEYHDLVKVSPTRYTATVTLDPERIVPDGFGGYTDNFDDCCDAYIQGTTGSSAGTYLLTVDTAPVPEPGAWALMILGFGAIGMTLRAIGRRAMAQPNAA